MCSPANDGVDSLSVRSDELRHETRAQTPKIARALRMALRVLRTAGDGGPEGLAVERLLEAAIANPREKRGGARGECAAGHEHEAVFETGVPARDLGEEIHARHVRHHQIAENHIVRHLRLNESVETLAATDGDMDIAFILEHSNDHRGQCGLVVDDENAKANQWSLENRLLHARCWRRRAA